MRFFGREGVDLLCHTARWSGAVQFAHAVARTPCCAHHARHPSPDATASWQHSPNPPCPAAATAR